MGPVGLGMVGSGPLQVEPGSSGFAAGEVGSVGVVVAAPVFDDHAGLQQGVQVPGDDSHLRWRTLLVHRHAPSQTHNPGRDGLNRSALLIAWQLLSDLIAQLGRCTLPGRLEPPPDSARQQRGPAPPGRLRPADSPPGFPAGNEEDCADINARA